MLSLFFFFLFHLAELYQSALTKQDERERERWGMNDQSKTEEQLHSFSEIMAKGLKIDSRLPVTKSLETRIHSNRTEVLILCGQFVV